MTSMQPPRDPTPPKPPTEKPRKDPSQCRICGAAALYSYYGAIVCYSCKIFFKRNATRQRGQLNCRFSSNCEITIHNRHICSACRLTKCFACGMQTELFRSSITRSDRRRSSERIDVVARRTTADVVAQVALSVSLNVPCEVAFTQLPTVSLLRADQSTLTTEQWTLLSNLIHCYDENSKFAVAERFIRDQNNLPIKMRYKVGPTDELLSACAGGSQLLFEKNAVFVSLSSHDQSLLIRNTIKHVGSLNAGFILDCAGLYENLAFCKCVESIYGASAFHYAKQSCAHFDHDPVFTKLILTVLIFSTPEYVRYGTTSSSNLRDANAVFRFQTMYIELIWRYLVYRYDDQRAVLCFANFLRTIFAIHESIVIIVDNARYMNIIDALIKRTEDALGIRH